MDGGHETFGEAEAFLEEHMDERREAVRGAGGVGDDVVLGGVVLVFVHAHDDGDVFVLGGSGDDDFLEARRQVIMALSFFGFGEEAGGFDDVVDAHRRPREFGWGLGGDDFDLVPVDDEDIIVGFGPGRISWSYD